MFEMVRLAINRRCEREASPGVEESPTPVIEKRPEKGHHRNTDFKTSDERKRTKDLTEDWRR